MIRAVLFDLDGTLADTAPDLTGALNRLLAEQGRLPMALEKGRRLASSGARGLIQAGFGLTPENLEYPALQQRFLEIYAAGVCLETCLFPQMDALLTALESRRLPWGIVTNKAARFTLPLVDALNLQQRAACVISGDTTSRLKPAPDSLLHAAELLGISAEKCIYVGDDLRDIQAARAAGMPALAAAWGYLGDAGDPSTWNADAIINAPAEILDFLS